MAVVFDAQSSADITGAAATSFSNSSGLTVGSLAQRALTVLISWSTSTAPTGISITWNGVALAQSVIHANGLGGTSAIYVLLNPDPGTNTLAGSWTGSRDFYVSGVSWSGVDQTNNATAFSPNFSVGTNVNAGQVSGSTLAGEVFVLLASVAGTITNTTNGTTAGTQIFLDNTQTTIRAAAMWAPTNGANIGLACLNANVAWVTVSVVILAGPILSTAQPRAPYVTKLPGRFFLPVPEQGYNQNLYTVVTVQAPFVSTDIFVAHGLKGTPALEPPLNINLFTNPIPFNQFDWLKLIKVPLTQPQPSPPLNINLFTNPYPFNQIDWLKPFRVPLTLPQPSPPLNINVFTNPFPFNQIDWLKPFNIPLTQPQPTPALNINLFTNPIPINQIDWSKSVRIPQSPFSPDQALNINLFTNPIPNLNVGTPLVSSAPRLPLADVPYNQNLYVVTVVAVPFTPLDFAPATRRLPSSPPLDPSYNPNLFTNPFPFNQVDWSKPFSVPRAQFSPDVAFNNNLFISTVVPTPFIPIDWARPFALRAAPLFEPPLNINIFTNPIPVLNLDSTVKPPRRASVLQDQAYNQNLYVVTVVAAPFYAYELLPLKRPVASPLLDQPFNLNLFTNPIPINQIDWSKPFRAPQSPFSPDQALNINIFTNPYPFNQIDWLKPFRVPLTLPQPSPALNINTFTNPIPVFNYDGSVSVRLKGTFDTTQPYNVNLYGIVVVQIPFTQFDSSKSFMPRPFPAGDQALNINLFKNPIPFAQFDWRKPSGVPQAPFDLSVQLNLNLFKNPIPFNQYQYPRQQPIVLGPPFVMPYNQNLYTATVAGTTLHVVKFIGNVGHFMIR